MDIHMVIEAATQEFKRNLRQQSNNWALDQLTPALAQQVSQGLKQALSAAECGRISHLSARV